MAFEHVGAGKQAAHIQHQRRCRVADFLRPLGLCKDIDSDRSAGRTPFGPDVADLARWAFDGEPFVEKGCLPNRSRAWNNVTNSIMIERLVPKVYASLR
jgi:hypothetical protein